MAKSKVLAKEGTNAINLELFKELTKGFLVGQQWHKPMEEHEENFSPLDS